MPQAKIIINPEGSDAQFRLVPDDDEREEGQIDDEDEEEEDDEEEDEDEEEGDHDNDGQAPKNLNATEKLKTQAPRISLFEMQSFLIALILPEPRLSTPPTWCRVVRCMKAANVGIFLLDNVDLDWIENRGSKFTYAFRFQTAPNWIEQLTNIPLSNRLQCMTLPREFGGLEGNFETNLKRPPRISKTSLLLSPIQQLVESYPMPFEEDIICLRTKFPAVSDDSPIFAIDCEMCITHKSELTRISIVDEELRTVYNELVKPPGLITNYLTRYSGITEAMMRDVTTTKEDVYYFLRKNLPKDSIFCGHSLNMDLAALGIFHPFVIDTSVIFNRAGTRSYKPSLKSLAYELLGKEIQISSKQGHDSLEDAVTAMELVKLKLVNEITFGDTVAYEAAEGIKFDSRTGITHLQFDKFIERHKATPLSYRCADTTPGARCVYIHDSQEPLEQGIKDAVSFLLNKDSAICVILTNSGECYVKI